MKYSLKWRRGGLFRFWKKEKNLTGHRIDPSLDKLFLFYEDGTSKEIAQWSRCDAICGIDFVNATKKAMEREAGQPLSYR